ncbi:MAG: PAQR family membrane homeostasis protein TrhA [Rubrobacteraceae bacterium]
MRPAQTRYTTAEELANSVTHGVGLAASVAGTMLLLVLTILDGDGWQIASSAVYGATLIVLYTASTLYHAFRRPEVKRVLRILDHCAIYLLIAGTYTPFALVVLRDGWWGWALFVAIWSLTVAGIVFKVFFTGRLNALSTAVYIIMGWLSVLVAKPLVETLTVGALVWIAAGGIAYTAGTVFYHNRRIPYSHAVWHLFVVAGSVCHFFAIYRHVMLPSA